MSNQISSTIKYFEEEGRQNLTQVLSSVFSAFKNREDIRACKLVIFTSFGEGPALAYSKLIDFKPKIIAVTYPPGYAVKRTDENGVEVETPVRISDRLREFFDGVHITVLSSRMPFEGLQGVESIRNDLKLIRDVLSLFGGGFSPCVQSVIQACDMGVVDIGEKVVAISGDCAAIITASNSNKFLSVVDGLSINEILCKPRNLTLSKKKPNVAVNITANLFPDKEIKLLPSR